MSNGIVLASPPDVFPAANYEHISIAGDFAYVAGQVARDQDGNLVGIGDAGVQAAQVYRNIGRILAHIGAMPQDVVKIMVFLTDRADSAAISAERKKFFGDHRPPHTGLVIGGLGSPEVKVEVEVIVYLPKGK